MLTLVVFSKSADADKIVVLVSEKSDAQKVNFWWDCKASQPSPLLGHIGNALTKVGLKPILQCNNEIKNKIHKSYRHAPLLNHEMINLANAIEGKRILSGTLQVVEQPPLPSLSLVHYKATLQLSVLDVDTEQQTGQIVLTAHGYKRTADDARKLAHQSLSAKLLQHMNSLISTKPKKVKKVTRRGTLVRVAGLSRAGELDTLKKTLSVLPGVKRVNYEEITTLGGTLLIEPKSSQKIVHEHLQTLPFSAVIVP